jgi:hypothetical protein
MRRRATMRWAAAVLVVGGALGAAAPAQASSFAVRGEDRAAARTNEVFVVTPTMAWHCYEDEDGKQSVCDPID